MCSRLLCVNRCEISKGLSRIATHMSSLRALRISSRYFISANHSLNIQVNIYPYSITSTLFKLLGQLPCNLFSCPCCEHKSEVMNHEMINVSKHNTS